MASFHKSGGHGSLSRASSTGSLYAQGGGGGGGSAANTEGPTDDEDSDGKNHAAAAAAAAAASAGAGSVSGGNSTGGSQSYRERRREAHTQAEQKRRDAIKRGYDYLQELVPITSGGAEGEGGDGGAGAGPNGACGEGGEGGMHGNDVTPNSPGDEMPGGANGKISKAAVLQRSIDYILQIQQQKKKQEEELSQLRKEMVALQIMHANYEQLVKAHNQGGGGGGDHQLIGGGRRAGGGGGGGDGGGGAGSEAVPSDVKFDIFRNFMDTLFDSFNDRVSMREFSELSAGVASWIEEQCKPQLLQEAMHGILETTRDKYQPGRAAGAAAAEDDKYQPGRAAGAAAAEDDYDEGEAATAAAAAGEDEEANHHLHHLSAGGGAAAGADLMSNSSYASFKAENASDPKF